MIHLNGVGPFLFSFLVAVIALVCGIILFILHLWDFYSRDMRRKEKELELKIRELEDKLK